MLLTDTDCLLQLVASLADTGPVEGIAVHEALRVSLGTALRRGARWRRRVVNMADVCEKSAQLAEPFFRLHFCRRQNVTREISFRPCFIKAPFHSGHISFRPYFIQALFHSGPVSSRSRIKIF